MKANQNTLWASLSEIFNGSVFVSFCLELSGWQDKSLEKSENFNLVMKIKHIQQVRRKMTLIMLLEPLYPGTQKSNEFLAYLIMQNNKCQFFLFIYFFAN